MSKEEILYTILIVLLNIKTFTRTTLTAYLVTNASISVGLEQGQGSDSTILIDPAPPRFTKKRENFFITFSTVQVLSCSLIYPTCYPLFYEIVRLTPFRIQYLTLHKSARFKIEVDSGFTQVCNRSISLHRRDTVTASCGVRKRCATINY